MVLDDYFFGVFGLCREFFCCKIFNNRDIYMLDREVCFLVNYNYIYFKEL